MSWNQELIVINGGTKGEEKMKRSLNVLMTLAFALVEFLAVSTACPQQPSGSEQN
jgi:hypothetical protein